MDQCRRIICKKISVTVPNNHTDARVYKVQWKSRGRHLKGWKCKAFVGFAGADDLEETRSPEIGIVAEGLRTVCVRLWKNSSNK